ncbi:MAG: type II toxin-antitoxin system HipA family toxin, partial [Saprospiraceae bacterium]
AEYDHYLVKLSLDEEAGYNREIVEYCYYLTAKKAGIQMMNSKLIDDKHFATLRFDRQHGEKQHVLTASGMTGWDFKRTENSNYENLFQLAVFLKLPYVQLEELYRRMIFNIIFANTDDHLKNHSFIYDKEQDSWSLAPAYDLTYALNPLLNFKFSNRALAVNGKRNNIILQDVLKVAEEYAVKNPRGIIAEVQDSIAVLENSMKENNVPIRIIGLIMKKIKPFD